MAPPAGAGPLRVTVPVVVVAAKDFGLAKCHRSQTWRKSCASRRSDDDRNSRRQNPQLSMPASIVAMTEVVTALVAIGNVASVAPAGMVTVAGGRNRLVSLLTSRTMHRPPVRGRPE